MRLAGTLAAALPLLLSCTGPAPGTLAPASPPQGAAVPAPAPAVPDETPAVPAAPAVAKPKAPVAPPDLAFRYGLMPLGGTGVDGWHVARPTYDGRGVLIGILDSGVDPSVPGLLTTSTGQPKILDLRNFSGEGDVPLVKVRPDAAGNIALPGGLVLGGADAARRVAADSLWYGGVIHELPYGDAPQADFNGNGSNRDSYGVVVVRSASGWVALIDTNGDGSLAGETPLADYLVGRQTFSFGNIAGAVNLSIGADGAPRLSLVMDTAGHGTHVAGIAAGNDLYGVRGFDGVAPGAQILGLKIADDARGGLSTTGSMIRAMEYAVRFAAEHRLPLVLNMSFGVGNEQPGAATMDSIVDAFLAAHPDVVFAISAGNDGPGTETMGMPASADLALTVGAVYPASFAPIQFGAPSPDVLGWWSSRGGELDKPDVVTPGMAYSTVPRWDVGDEIKLGTSMASPYAAGMAALLVSAMRAEAREVTAAQVTQALRATARHLNGETAIDEGYGLPQIEAAYQWLRAGHAAARFLVRALPPTWTVSGPAGLMRAAPAQVVRPADRPSAAYRREGLLGPADTLQRFTVTAVPAGGAAAFTLRSEVPWLAPVAPSVTFGAGGTAQIEVRLDAARLTRPGRYVGAVDAVSAADTGAGTAFRVVCDVIVPDTATWAAVGVAAAKLSPNRAARYYVRVPAGAADLSLRVGVPDTSARGFLYLYEPGGRPSRTKDHLDLGGSAGTGGTMTVPANDLSPGIWEAVVQAVPGQELRYSFGIGVPPFGVAAVDSTGSAPGVTFASQSAHDTTLRVSAQQVGVATSWAATVENGATYRRTVAAPVWARQVVVDVQVTPDFWSTVTDFGVTLYDRDGAQLGQGAMNYAFNRVTADLPPKHGAGYPVTVELFPAFATTVPPASFVAQVRVAFLGPPRELTSAPATLTFGPHGSARFAIPAFTPFATSPEWSDLIRVRAVGADGDWVSVERQVAVSP